MGAEIEEASPLIVNGHSKGKGGPRTNAKRLWQDIHYTAQWGAIPNTSGMQRLALSDADKSTRDWFVMQATILGCEVRVDAIGNIFATLPGENMDFAPVGMGSHLDTQPAGGSSPSSEELYANLRNNRWKIRRHSGCPSRSRGTSLNQGVRNQNICACRFNSLDKRVCSSASPNLQLDLNRKQ